MKIVYEIVKTTGEFKDRDEIKTGCTIECISPEFVKEFSTKQEALEELKKFSTSIEKFGDYFRVTEYSIEENLYDDDGEWIGGGDISDWSEMVIELIEKGYHENMVIASFDNYSEAEDAWNSYEGDSEVYISY